MCCYYSYTLDPIITRITETGVLTGRLEVDSNDQTAIIEKGQISLQQIKTEGISFNDQYSIQSNDNNLANTVNVRNVIPFAWVSFAIAADKLYILTAHNVTTVKPPPHPNQNFVVNFSTPSQEGHYLALATSPDATPGIVNRTTNSFELHLSTYPKSLQCKGLEISNEKPPAVAFTVDVMIWDSRSLNKELVY